MFFVSYDNEMTGLVHFRIGLVSRQTKRSSEAKSVSSILLLGRGEMLDVELITIAGDFIMIGQ